MIIGLIVLCFAFKYLYLDFVREYKTNAVIQLLRTKTYGSNLFLTSNRSGCYSRCNNHHLQQEKQTARSNLRRDRRNHKCRWLKSQKAQKKI